MADQHWFGKFEGGGKGGLAGSMLRGGDDEDKNRYEGVVNESGRQIASMQVWVTRSGSDTISERFFATVSRLLDIRTYHTWWLCVTSAR